MRGSRISTLLLAALIAVPAGAQEGKGPPPAPVVVAEAESRTLAPVTWYPGTVISRNQARVAAEVPGRLELGRRDWRGDRGRRDGGPAR